jgi:hypothetical protein
MSLAFSRNNRLEGVSLSKGNFMVWKRIRLALIAGVLLTFIGDIPSFGSEPAPPVKLTLHPAPLPIPALKYRLLPSRLDQTPGNAAVHYGKVTAEHVRFFSNRDGMLDRIDRGQTLPLEDIRSGKAGNLPIDDDLERPIRRGAHCRICDWQLPIGDGPFYTMPLPEVQQTRTFARILCVRARMQMAEGDFADAVDTLQCGYALARHVATGETIVNGLVGIAICEIMSRQVFDFVQQPKSPNLYWALTTLPQPLIEIREALDVERMGIELSFPELSGIESAKRTPEEWRTLFHGFAKEVMEQSSNNDSPPPLTADQLDERCQQLLPAAQQTLIGSGLAKDQVEAMPIHQVALLYTPLIHREMVDDVSKYYNLPYPQASAGIDAVFAQANEREIIPLAAQMGSGFRAARSAVARNERSIAVLRVFESLRLYAAMHSGKLPDSLSDIVEVPVPVDPVTGAAFDYQLEGEVATLQAAAFRGVAVNYEITMVSP